MLCISGEPRAAWSPRSKRWAGARAIQLDVTRIETFAAFATEHPRIGVLVHNAVTGGFVQITQAVAV